LEEIEGEFRVEKCFLYEKDKEGLPFIIILAKNYDKTIDLNKITKYTYYLLENLVREAERRGKSKISIIYDRTGFRLS
jgi:hypothetical protein